MSNTIIDIVARIKLYHTNEGGRESSTQSDRFACIFEFEKENFSCFFNLTDIGPLYPGFAGNVPIAFLSPKLIKHRLKIGSQFLLKECRIIGEGEVIDIRYN